MRSRRGLVSFGRLLGALLVALMQQVHDFLRCRGDNLAYAGHLHASFGVLAQLEKARRRTEQVAYELVVDLEIAHGHLIDELIGQFGNFDEQVVERAKHDAGLFFRAQHRVGLARTSRSVRKHGCVVAVQDFRQQ